jgi:hypothetical protein
MFFNVADTLTVISTVFMVDRHLYIHMFWHVSRTKKAKDTIPGMGEGVLFIHGPNEKHI